PATDILLIGLRYPWPAVAKNAAEAIVQLRRADLASELATMLDQPDPRAPIVREVNGMKIHVVRELVRINHHRNCLLCHPPANTPDIMRQGKIDAANLFTDKSLETLTAEAPPNGQPTSAAYYGPSFPDNLVRADITYLRQDFSMVQQVLDDKSTPFPQRFD